MAGGTQNPLWQGPNHYNQLGTSWRISCASRVSSRETSAERITPSGTRRWRYRRLVCYGDPTSPVSGTGVVFWRFAKDYGL